MKRYAGGNKVNTFVGLGLTAGLFVTGWVVLGFMLLMDELFGGTDETEHADTAEAAKAAEARARAAAATVPVPTEEPGTA
jgi:hypothetical protein